MPIVIDELQHDSDEMARGKAAIILHDVVQFTPREELQEAVPYLQAALKDKSTLVRYEAFDTLHVITGKYYPYEGMSDEQKKEMLHEPQNIEK